MALIDSLISAWLFNNNVTDEHGSNDGTATGITYTTGVMGQAAVYNSADRIVVADHSTIDFDAEDFSISAWVNPDDTNRSRYIADKSNDTGQIDFRLWCDSQTIKFEFDNSSGAVQRATSGNVLTTGWQHIVATYKESTKALTIYRNGVSVATATASYSNSSGSDHLTIGAHYIPGEYADNFLYGDIDQLCLWSSCLTASDAVSLYNSGAGWEYPFSPFANVGAFESVSEFLAGYQLSIIQVGALLSISDFFAGAKQTDIKYFFAGVNHVDGGAYNPAGVVAITENGYKLAGELTWDRLDSGYADENPRQFVADAAGNLYLIGMDNDNSKVFKATLGGTIIWIFSITTGAATHIAIDNTGEYLYIANDYTSARITKVNAATGIEVTGGGWPVTSSTDLPECSTFLFGRDGYIYISDAKTFSGSCVGRITKIDPADGAVEWQWRVNSSLDRWLNRIAINASGFVIAYHDAITVSNRFSVIGPDGVTDASWNMVTGSFDVDIDYGIAINDDGYIFLNNAHGSLMKISKDTTDPLTDYEWALPGELSLTVGSLSDDDVYLYALGSVYISEIGALVKILTKRQTSNGSIVWTQPVAVPDDEWSFLEVPIIMPQKEGWFQTFTVAADGEVSSNIDIAINNGDYAAVADEDFTFAVEPDAGYKILSVIINGVTQ